MLFAEELDIWDIARDFGFEPFIGINDKVDPSSVFISGYVFSTKQ